MAICKDCIHEGLCLLAYNELLDEFEETEDCKHFKNKANFVEVRICDKCVEYESDLINEGIGWCNKLSQAMRKESFCSYGKGGDEDA